MKARDERLNNSFQASRYRVIMPRHNFRFGRNSRDENRSAVTGPFFFARLSRAVIGWPCKKAIVGKRKGKTCTESRLEEGAEELLRGICMRVFIGPASSFPFRCRAPRKRWRYSNQLDLRMYVFNGEQNAVVFTAKKPILCQWSVPMF